MHSTLLGSLLALFALSNAWASAADPAARPEPAPAHLAGPELVPVDFALRPHGTGLEVETSRFRARYAAGQLVFEPASQREAKPTLALELDSIARGGEVLFRTASLGDRRPPVQAVDGGFAAAWPGFVELYEPRSVGLEQSFVFPTALRGSGDLVVRLRVETELTRIYASAPRVAWGCEGEGVYAMQHVVGIDARGRTARGSLRPVDGGVELVLPGDFVDSASFPLVLDPLILPLTTFWTQGPGAPEIQLTHDVAASSAEDLACVVFRQETGASTALYAGWLNSGALVGAQLVAVEVTDWNTVNTMACCYMPSSDHFLIAAGTFEGPDSRIGLHTVTPFEPGTVASSWVPAPNLHSLDLAGNSNPTRLSACLVWTGGEDPTRPWVMSRLVDVDFEGGIPAATDSITLETSSMGINYGATLSESNGAHGHWLATWWSFNSEVPADSRPHYAAIDATGSVAGFGVGSYAGGGASCDGDGRTFLLAYSPDSPDGTNAANPYLVVERLRVIPGGIQVEQKGLIQSGVGPLFWAHVAIVASPESVEGNVYAVACMSLPIDVSIYLVRESDLAILDWFGAYLEEECLGYRRITSPLGAQYDPEHPGAGTFVYTAGEPQWLWSLEGGL